MKKYLQLCFIIFTFLFHNLYSQELMQKKESGKKEEEKTPTLMQKGSEPEIKLNQAEKYEEFEKRQQEKDYIVRVEKKEEYDPWYTGPLLAPSAHNVPPGLVNIQPYLFVTNAYGHFDSTWTYHSVHGTIQVNPLIILQTGITKVIDITGTFQMFYNEAGNKSAWNYGDTTIQFGWQALINYPSYWIPDIRITLSEIFPTGNFQKFNPRKKSVDGSGSGSFETAFSINMSKVFHAVRFFPLFRYNPMSIRLSLGYTLPTPVRVTGFNTYGGGFGTKGKVYPGNIFAVISSIEYSITQRVVLACDFEYVNVMKSTFKGTLGSLLGGDQASMGNGSTDVISLAPAIEYNLNSNFGALAGIWFSVWGKNANDFVSGVFSFTWTF